MAIVADGDARLDVHFVQAFGVFRFGNDLKYIFMECILKQCFCKKKSVYPSVDREFFGTRRIWHNHTFEEDSNPAGDSDCDLDEWFLDGIITVRSLSHSLRRQDEFNGLDQVEFACDLAGIFEIQIINMKLQMKAT